MAESGRVLRRAQCRQGSRGNKRFPIAQAFLAARFPEIHDVVFLNLAQTEGPAVIISVGTFIARLATRRETTAGKAALKLLAKRGITDAVIE